jgi:predicted lipoprotein with Yx(FWY)xxD motif
MQRLMVRNLAIAAVAAMALAACSSSSKTSASTPTKPVTTSAAPTNASAPTSTSATTAKATVATASTKLGTVLVDSKGMTLYTSSGDTTPGASSCTGGCATIWPPLAVTATPIYAAGLTASKFATITRSDGTKQLAYNGKPLYTFANDSAAGATTGQGVGGFAVATAS